MHLWSTQHRLFALTVAGSLLAIAGLFAGSFHTVWSSLPLMITAFVCVLSGLLAMFWATHTLREGIQNELWPADTVAPFRRMTSHLLWKILVVSGILKFLGFGV